MANNRTITDLIKKMSWHQTVIPVPRGGIILTIVRQRLAGPRPEAWATNWSRHLCHGICGEWY